jgi:hypothetical protein
LYPFVGRAEIYLFQVTKSAPIPQAKKLEAIFSGGEKIRSNACTSLPIFLRFVVHFVASNSWQVLKRVSRATSFKCRKKNLRAGLVALSNEKVLRGGAVWQHSVAGK